VAVPTRDRRFERGPGSPRGAHGECDEACTVVQRGPTERRRCGEMGEGQGRLTPSEGGQPA